MKGLSKKLTPEKLDEIQTFLQDRFTFLENLRQPFDDAIQEEIKAFNNEDVLIDALPEYKERIKIPYIYTLVQTAIARIIKSLFPYKNYVKIYVEDPKHKDIQGDITKWAQEELDKINFSSRARDFIEEGAIKRLCWLQLRPIPISRTGKDGKVISGYQSDFDIIDFFNVWFDTKARTVDDTDFFIRKRKKLWEIKTRPDIYFNLDKISAVSNDEPDDENRQEFQSKHSSETISNTSRAPDYYENQPSFKMTDEVDIYEYYGLYDFSDTQLNEAEWKPGMKEVICTLANKTTLIRVEVNDIPFKRKRLFFPIRPLRQANSLIGKGFPQLTKSLQHNLNVVRSAQLDNFKLVINLLFKYKRDADIDKEEIYAGAGNAIGVDEMNDIDIFNIPNMTGAASLMAQQTMADMQAITGAVDTIIGSSSGAGTPDTARGISTVTEQAMFRFGMMTENVYDDILDCINYLLLLQIEYNRDIIMLRHPKLMDFLDLPVEDLENSYIIDIVLKDLSQRRENELREWTSLTGFLSQALPAVGGNMKLFVKELMEQFEMRNVDSILEPEDPSQFISKLMSNPALLQQVMQVVAQQQGAQASAEAAPQGPAA